MARCRKNIIEFVLISRLLDDTQDLFVNSQSKCFFNDLFLKNDIKTQDTFKKDLLVCINQISNEKKFPDNNNKSIVLNNMSSDQIHYKINQIDYKIEDYWLDYMVKMIESFLKLKNKLFLEQRKWFFKAVPCSLEKVISGDIDLKKELKKIFIHYQWSLFIGYQKYRYHKDLMEQYETDKNEFTQQMQDLIKEKSKIFSFNYKDYKTDIGQNKELLVYINQSIKVDILWFLDMLEALKTDTIDDMAACISFFSDMQTNYLTRIQNHTNRYRENHKSIADLEIEKKYGLLIEVDDDCVMITDKKTLSSDSLFWLLQAKVLKDHTLHIKYNKSQPWSSKLKDIVVIHMPLLLNTYMSLPIQYYLGSNKISFLTSLVASFLLGEIGFPLCDRFNSQQEELEELFDKKDIRKWIRRGISFTLAAFAQWLYNKIIPSVIGAMSISLYLLHLWYVTWESATDRAKSQYNILTNAPYPHRDAYVIRDLKLFKEKFSE